MERMEKDYEANRYQDILQKAKPIIHQINVSLKELCNGTTKKLKITRSFLLEYKKRKHFDLMFDEEQYFQNLIQLDLISQ